MSFFLLMMSSFSAYADEILIPHFYTKTEVPMAELATFEAEMVDGLRGLEVFEGALKGGLRF